MQNKIAIYIVGVAIFIAGCAGPDARITKFAEAVTTSEEARDIPTINKLSDSIASADLTPAALSRYSDSTLNTLYETLSKVSFYSPDVEYYVLRQELVFNEKLRRGKYNNEDLEDMNSTFLESRLFTKASDLKHRFPQVALSAIPVDSVSEISSSSSGWRAYNVSEHGNKVELTLLPLGDGPRIIMFASPGCGAAESAIKNILNDTELGPIFIANGIIVTRKYDPAGVESIKEKFNFPYVYIAHKSSDFPGLQLQPSPHLYFLKDGRSLYEFKSWSSENNGEYSKKKVRKGLAAIGITTKTEQVSKP